MRTGHKSKAVLFSEKVNSILSFDQKIQQLCSFSILERKDSDNSWFEPTLINYSEFLNNKDFFLSSTPADCGN